MAFAISLLRVAAWFCVVLLAVLSLLPADDMVRTGIGGQFEHALAYAGTAFLLGLSHPAWGWKKPAIGLVIYAGALEVLQNLSAGRHPAVEDWLAGAAGVVVGTCAAILADKLWRR